jgi:hypothetical protein
MEWLAETGADEDYEVVGAEQQIAVPLQFFRGAVRRAPAPWRLLTNYDDALL